MAKLSGKRKLFVKEYLLDLNATQAYLRAGYRCSEEAARRAASRLLTNVDVQAEIHTAMKAREKRTDISSDRVVKELAKIAFADIKDFMSFRTDLRVVDRNEDGDPVYDVAQIVEMKKSEDVDGSLINEVSISRDGTLKFKLHDKKSALEMLGRHLGMFVEHQEIKVTDKTPRVAMKNLSDDELRQLAALAAAKNGGASDGDNEV